MLKNDTPWTDEGVEKLIGGLLRTGVIISATAVVIGGFFYLYLYSGVLPDFRIFYGEPTDLRSVNGIIRDALSLHLRGLIQLGLLLLVFTPIARVFFSLFAFLKERDYIYVVITLIVLATLIFSISGNHK